MGAKPRSEPSLPWAVGRCGSVLLGGLLVLAAGAAVAAPVVPWRDQRPARELSHPPLAPACRAGQLRARVFLQGETGSLAGEVTVTNVAVAAGSLLGRPRVAFTGPSAGSARWRGVPTARQRGPLDVLGDAPASLRALAPGKAAGGALGW